MNRIFIFIPFFLTCAIIVSAQTDSSVPTAKKSQSTTVSPTSFESSLVQGKLALLKVFTKEGANSEFSLVYKVVSYSNTGLLNNGKPVSIRLNQQSLDSLFTRTSPELSAKSASIKKYVLDNKISLTEEKGWVSVLNYFNRLN